MKNAIVSILLFQTFVNQEKDVTVFYKGIEVEKVEIGILSQMNDDDFCKGDEIVLWVFPIEGDTFFLKDVPCQSYLSSFKTIIEINHKKSVCTEAVLHVGNKAMIIGKRRESRCTKKVNAIHLFREE